MLGSVRKGAQVGALAETVHGDYVQVVGDFVVALNRGQLARAIAAATSVETYRAVRPIRSPAAAPVVVVKRRRIPANA